MNDMRIDRVRGSAETLVRWSPIRDLPVDVRLGISDDCRWVLQTAEGLIRLDEADNLTGLLPLLERSPSDIHSSLVRTLSAYGLPEAVAENFPTEELIVFGLNAWGKHWPMMGLHWAETRPATDAVATVLRRLVDEGRTQEIRHGAKRLLARWKRPGP
jgi:hypothetical protein